MAARSRRATRSAVRPVGCDPSGKLTPSTTQVLSTWIDAGTTSGGAWLYTRHETGKVELPVTVNPDGRLVIGTDGPGVESGADGVLTHCTLVEREARLHASR